MHGDAEQEMTELLVSDLVAERERKELVLWGNTEGFSQIPAGDFSLQTDCVQRKVPTSTLCVGAGVSTLARMLWNLCSRIAGR